MISDEAVEAALKRFYGEGSAGFSHKSLNRPRRMRAAIEAAIAHDAEDS